ncbi:MAG TPA: MFS transporter [Candidatus Saccharimonadales bacterium]|nr:MFS transporter [Candidatus Saccharimonadales bacterium]
MARTKPTHKNIILTIMALAQFMVVLDVSIVNIALPSIFRSLHFTSESNLQWIVTAYTLAFGGFLLLGGRAADLFGRRKMFIAGVTVFSAASLMTGLAQTSTMIEITRAIQGLAAAFMSPAALSIVLTTFKEGKERNKALSVWGGIAAGGAAFGVLLGGLLTQYFSWRWNFFVNVPVGILVVIATTVYIKESKAELDHSQLDLPGAVFATGGLMLLVYGLTKAPSYGWTATHTIELLGSSVALLIAFLINETYTKHPLLPLKFFKIKNIAAANLTQLPITASLYSMFFFITLYVQDVLHYSPVRAGVSFLPITFIIGFIAIMMSRVIGKVGYKKPLVVAPLFMAAGLFYLTHVRVDGSYVHDVLPGLILMSMGLGAVFVSITVAATTGVPHRESGLASGLLNTAQQIGGSLGLAILSGIATSETAKYLASHAYQQNANLHAQVNGFHYAFYAGVGFAVLAFLFAVFLIRQKKSEKVEFDPTAGVGA